MLDMDRPTDFNRRHDGLEEFLMACVCVAGKSAHVQADRLTAFLAAIPRVLGEANTPFAKVRRADAGGTLRARLEAVGMGKYDLIERSFRAMAADPGLDLFKAGVADLMRLPGVGMKTARFFVLHTRPDTRVAVLDTHLRKHLVGEGFAPPAFPPSSPLVYRVREETVLRLVDRAGLTPAEYDLAAWSAHRRPPAARGPRPGRRGRTPALQSPA